MRWLAIAIAVVLLGGLVAVTYGGEVSLTIVNIVTPQDVKTIGYDVLRHRILVTYEAEAEEITTETLIRRIFDHLKVP